MSRMDGEDRRTQKTRKALHEALISLMFEKRYDSILVQEILDHANVGRSTFYTHFRDKDELLVEGLQGLEALLREAQIRAARPSDPPHERVIAFSLAMFEHAGAHDNLYRSLVGGPGWIMVRLRMEGIVQQLIRPELHALFGRHTTSEASFELLVHFLSTTFMSVLTWWFDFKRALSPQEVNALFRDLVLPTLASRLSAAAS